MSCKDSKNECGKGAGTTVGGYAWTYSGWFGYYYYITLCPTFFTASNVSTILQLREEDLAAGNTNTVTDMRYFRTTGQMFLHEMMHLDLIGNPHSKPASFHSRDLSPVLRENLVMSQTWIILPSRFADIAYSCGSEG